MKTSLKVCLVIASLFSISVLLNSCAKKDYSIDVPKQQLVVGKWNINRIQLKIFEGGVFVKDTILKQTPKPENYVSFNASGAFEYRFNTSNSDKGTFEFAGSNMLISNSAPNTYNWTILTLTRELFTVVSKGTDPSFSGAVVERYQTFVR